MEKFITYACDLAAICAILQSMEANVAIPVGAFEAVCVYRLLCIMVNGGKFACIALLRKTINTGFGAYGRIQRLKRKPSFCSGKYQEVIIIQWTLLRLLHY